MKWVTGVAVVIAIGLGAQNFFLSWENQTLKNLKEVTQVEHALLQDQLRDYESRLSNTRTYDEGYMAAMLRSANNGEYVEGYHAAMAQVFSNSMICDPRYQDLKQKFESEKSKLSQDNNQPVDDGFTPRDPSNKPVLESSFQPGNDKPLPKNARLYD